VSRFGGVPRRLAQTVGLAAPSPDGLSVAHAVLASEGFKITGLASATTHSPNCRASTCSGSTGIPSATASCFFRETRLQTLRVAHADSDRSSGAQHASKNVGSPQKKVTGSFRRG
jgi:hypothetical protein